MEPKLPTTKLRLLLVNLICVVLSFRELTNNFTVLF
jgi:hypothetical protein